MHFVIHIVKLCYDNRVQTIITNFSASITISFPFTAAVWHDSQKGIRKKLTCVSTTHHICIVCNEKNSEC